MISSVCVCVVVCLCEIAVGVCESYLEAEFLLIHFLVYLLCISTCYTPIHRWKCFNAGCSGFTWAKCCSAQIKLARPAAGYKTQHLFTGDLTFNSFSERFTPEQHRNGFPLFTSFETYYNNKAPKLSLQVYIHELMLQQGAELTKAMCESCVESL